MRATRIRGEVIFRSNEVWLMWLNSAKTRSELSTKNPCGWIVTGPRTTSIVAENQWLEDWKMEISQLKMIPFLGTCQFLFVERFPPGGFELVAFVAMGSPPLSFKKLPQDMARGISKHSWNVHVKAQAHEVLQRLVLVVVVVVLGNNGVVVLELS